MVDLIMRRDGVGGSRSWDSSQNQGGGGSVNITGIAGTRSDGATWTYTGTGFGTKANGKPLYWSNFASSVQPSALGLNASWPYLSPTSALYTGTVSGRTGTFLSDDISKSSGSMGVEIDNIPSTDYMFVSVDKCYTFDIATNLGPAGLNLKIFRIWPDQFGATIPWGNNIYGAYQGLEEPNSFRSTNEYCQATGYGTLIKRNNSDALYQYNQWDRYQVAFKESGLDTQDGIFSIYRNGVNWMKNWKDDATGTVYAAERQWVLSTSARYNKHTKFVFDQVSNGTGVGPLVLYYDRIYVDNTWARVMLSNSSTFAAATDLEMQIPQTWTSTQVTAVVNYGNLNQAAPIYAYIVDALGNVNANGALT